MSERRTSTFSVLVPITPVRLLPANSLRVLYSIQNLDAANYVAVSTYNNVTAGVGVSTDGQTVVAGGYVSDDTDQAEVWCIANTAACRIVVQEVSLHAISKPRTESVMPKPGSLNPRHPYKAAGRKPLRLDSRQHG